jgi:hypothetical protein
MGMDFMEEGSSFIMPSFTSSRVNPRSVSRHWHCGSALRPDRLARYEPTGQVPAYRVTRYAFAERGHSTATLDRPRMLWRTSARYERLAPYAYYLELHLPLVQVSFVSGGDQLRLWLDHSADG